MRAAGGTGNVGETKFEFTLMAPGWHVTMGSGGLLFPRAGRAEGRFVLEGEMIYRPDGSNDAEIDVFAGGVGLDGAHGSWTAFVVRADRHVAAHEPCG